MALPEDPEEQAAWRRAVASWFRDHARELPWREPRFREDPYAVLVSEVMLQQTRVEAVIPYFLAWMDRWPTVEDLAQATGEEVLSHWQGLGYYNRARRLHAAAQRIVDEHGGQLPRDPKVLEELPGIGPYTAAAVAALAFDEPLVAADGNVVRLWARLEAQAVDPTDPKSKRRACDALTPLVPNDHRAGETVEALIELGATVCTPTGPACRACPVTRWCSAHQHDRVDEVPSRPDRGELPTKEVVALLVGDQDQILLHHRAPDGLLGGLWGLPMVERRPSEPLAGAAQRALGGACVQLGRGLATVEHTFTHKRWTVRVHRCVDPSPPPTGPEWTWVDPDRLDDLPRARLDEKVFEALGQLRAGLPLDQR